jgi:uncharacterized protein YjbI with pentapeptide repeats
MANAEHLEILERGAAYWNAWRRENRAVVPDLERMTCGFRDVSMTNSWTIGTSYFHGGERISYVDRQEKVNLEGAQMRGANLSGADLRNTFLRDADLREADLSRAVVEEVDLHGASLIDANLSNAVFTRADLSEATLDRVVAYRCDLEQVKLARAGLIGANLRSANLSRADLRYAELEGANLSDANLAETNLTGCSVYGVSVWNTKLDRAIQSNLVITRSDEPKIQVDNLEVAQFIHLLLNNRRLRGVIDSITSKVVLILGRFTPERKDILEDIRDELRSHNYLPVLFDFDKPLNRDITETVSTLAHLARFVVADITDAKSIPQELLQIVPALPSVPIQPLLLASQQEYGMFEHFRHYPWVLEPFLYESRQALLDSLLQHVIAPAEAKAKEQTGRGAVSS